MGDGNHTHADDPGDGIAFHPEDVAVATPVPQDTDIYGYDDTNASEESLIPESGGLDDGYADPYEHDDRG